MTDRDDEMMMQLLRQAVKAQLEKEKREEEEMREAWTEFWFGSDEE